jgi:lysophospholipase L1-like esterase
MWLRALGAVGPVVFMLWTISALLRAFMLPPRLHPWFVRKGKRKMRVLVAAGASATHGRASYDWLSELDRRIRNDGWSCLNLAWNGRRAADVAASVGSVAALEPDAVVIMVGVNDVNMFTSIESYRSSLLATVDYLLAHTKARIGLCTLTAIGDDLECSAMKRAAVFNETVREIASIRGVRCIDVAEAQRQWLSQRRPTLWPVVAFLPLMLCSIFLHYALFFPWNWVSRVLGLRLTTDLVHQNSIGGLLIADRVEQFVREI